MYPIRVSRPWWDVHLRTRHECSNVCRIEVVRQYTEDMTGVELILRRRTDLVNDCCPMHGKVQMSRVFIADFDEANPQCVDGPLVNAGTVVVPDEEATLRIEHPLTRPYEKTIRRGGGFTLVALLAEVKKAYEALYEEEERTASVRTFHLERLCTSCILLEDDEVVDLCSPKHDQDCSICFGALSESAARTRCGHVFHAQCLKQWMQQATSCPICRSALHHCDKCNGQGVIKFEYTGTVVPIDYSNLRRITTDGTYGVHTMYLQNVTVEKIRYDRRSHTVTLK